MSESEVQVPTIRVQPRSDEYHIIRIKRRIDGAPGPPLLADLRPAEPAYNDNGHTLYISNGTDVVTLVGADRQVELTGGQTITGNKTIAILNLKVPGGSAGQVIFTDGSGNLNFGSADIVPILPISNILQDTTNVQDALAKLAEMLNYLFMVLAIKPTFLVWDYNPDLIWDNDPNVKWT